MGVVFYAPPKILYEMILNHYDATSVGFFTDMNEYWGFKYDYSYRFYNTNSIKNEIAVSDILKHIKR